MCRGGCLPPQCSPGGNARPRAPSPGEDPPRGHGGPMGALHVDSRGSSRGGRVVPGTPPGNRLPSTVSSLVSASGSYRNLYLTRSRYDPDLLGVIAPPQ